VPAIVAASIGVAIGVYISYRGGSHSTPPKASVSHMSLALNRPQR